MLQHQVISTQNADIILAVLGQCKVVGFNLNPHFKEKYPQSLRLIHTSMIYPISEIIQCMGSANERRSWWRHQMETFSVLLAICASGAVTGEFPAERPVTRRFDVFFDLRVNISSRSLWLHFNGCNFMAFLSLTDIYIQNDPWIWT